jgi:hypothetical protein
MSEQQPERNDMMQALVAMMITRGMTGDSQINQNTTYSIGTEVRVPAYQGFVLGVCLFCFIFGGGVVAILTRWLLAGYYLNALDVLLIAVVVAVLFWLQLGLWRAALTIRDVAASFFLAVLGTAMFVAMGITFFTNIPHQLGLPRSIAATLGAVLVLAPMPVLYQMVLNLTDKWGWSSPMERIFAQPVVEFLTGRPVDEKPRTFRLVPVRYAGDHREALDIPDIDGMRLDDIDTDLYYFVDLADREGTLGRPTLVKTRTRLPSGKRLTKRRWRRIITRLTELELVRPPAGEGHGHEWTTDAGDAKEYLRRSFEATYEQYREAA